MRHDDRQRRGAGGANGHPVLSFPFLGGGIQGGDGQVFETCVGGQNLTMPGQVTNRTGRLDTGAGGQGGVR